MRKHLRTLGIYVSIVALLHLGLYVTLNLFHERLGWLFYFDTRIGLFFIESILRPSEAIPPALTAWLIEIGLLLVGSGMIAGKYLIKTYVILESILTIPYFLFFFLIIASGMRSNHGFSSAELLIPSVVVIVASVLPLVYAIWIHRMFGQTINISTSSTPDGTRVEQTDTII